MIIFVVANVSHKWKHIKELPLYSAECPIRVHIPTYISLYGEICFKVALKSSGFEF
jgi:hypothetical protein